MISNSYNRHASFSKSGFSFIEALVVVAVSGMVMYTIVSSLVYFYRSNAYSVEQAIATTEARRGVEGMVRDVREATFSDGGEYPVISMSTSSFEFFSDVDRDQSVEKVRYFLDGSTFNRSRVNRSGNPPEYPQEDEVVSVISSDARNESLSESVFLYFDELGQEVTDLTRVSDVRYVRVNLVVNVNPNRLPNDFTLRSNATLRNVTEHLR